jgi:hypothetical protein
MQCAIAVFWVLLSGLVATAQELEQHTIKSNLEYRLTQGGLPQLSFGIEKPKNVEVIKGGEELRRTCLADPVRWAQDPLLFRLAHAHAASIQSCRENRSPSLHAIFRQAPNEPLEVWVDLDGHGSQTSGSRMAHLAEFLYHKITFQNNDQDRMFQNLLRSFASPLGTFPRRARPFTLHDRLEVFTAKTLTQVQPYASSLISSAFLELFSPTRVWGQGTDEFTNHLFASFTKRLVTYGIQSGAAAALHEDLRYKPSLSGNVWKRSGHALLSTLIIETPRGNDVAFANMVAAVGSAVIINTSHPGQENPEHQRTWTLSGENLLGFAEGNLWNEFKPDVKHFVRNKLLRMR